VTAAPTPTPASPTHAPAQPAQPPTPPARIEPPEPQQQPFGASPHHSFTLNSPRAPQAQAAQPGHRPKAPFTEEEQGGLSAALENDVYDLAGQLSSIALRRQPWIECVIQYLRDLVAQIWPAARLEVYGSFASGLSVPSSDVDLVLKGVGASGTWFGTSGPPLSMLEQVLKLQYWVQSVTFIASATVPVLKMSTGTVPSHEHVSGNTIHVDITWDPEPDYAYLSTLGVVEQQLPAPEHKGMQTSTFVQRLCKRMPLLRPMVLVLKEFLKGQGLNDPYKGGLSSYALTVMAAAVLNVHALKPPSQKPGLGALFVEFMLTFSSRNFDTRKRGVSVAPNGPLVEISPLHFPNLIPRVNTEQFFSPAVPVLIQDPLAPDNNLGRSCFGFMLVQYAFDEVLERLKRWHDERQRGGVGGASATTALGAVFNTAHHASITRLSQSIWCPPERAGSAVPLVVEDAKRENAEAAEEIQPEEASRLAWLKAALDGNDRNVLDLLALYGFARKPF